MSPGDQPRDWDKELAQIDKLIAAGAGDAAASAPAGQRAGGPGGGPLARPPVGPSSVAGAGRRAILFTWFRVVLGVLLGAGLTQWPYAKNCGLPLFGYLGGVAALVAVALSGMASSWKSRSGFAHALSVGLLFWGSALAALEVLPRIGYAQQKAVWLCETRPAQPAQPPVRQPATPPSTPQAQDSF
ncbi:MAG: hypothetical protein HYR48_00380 [Gemmatimonadetes bacterium]|nr:hypothetical protein [Gemmatimonadota bacterium]